MKQIKTKRKSKTRKTTNPSDITVLMLEHHKPLKQLIKLMKNSELGISKLRAAFASFVPLLSEHATPEEIALYTYMEKEDSEMRKSGFEGHAEHEIADQLVYHIESITDAADWKAQVKVLAEIVEHHIKEEENEMIPELIRKLDQDERVKIGEEYLQQRKQYFLEMKIA